VLPRGPSLLDVPGSCMGHSGGQRSDRNRSSEEKKDFMHHDS
jgi:hypothetical protein